MSLYTYTTITRPQPSKDIYLFSDFEEVDIRVEFSFDQTPYELELSFEGASIEEQCVHDEALTIHELGQIETWFYTKGYEDALQLAREEIASNYQEE